MHKVFIEGSQFEEQPDEGINSSIRALPEDKQHHSNAEIEGQELVLRAGLDALHKAVGKKHSKGGMEVSLDEGDFIYSADPSLKVTKSEAKLFELKTPKTKKPKAWTPAKIVEKNVDVEDYNRLINVLGEKNSDDVAKTSAAMMLQKYVNTLGQVAYIQESKKGEPVPEFAMGSMPVYNTELKEEMDAQKQYMQDGGTYGGARRIGNRRWMVNARFRNRGTAPVPVTPPTSRFIPTIHQRQLSSLESLLYNTREPHEANPPIPQAIRWLTPIEQMTQSASDLDPTDFSQIPSTNTPGAPVNMFEMKDIFGPKPAAPLTASTPTGAPSPVPVTTATGQPPVASQRQKRKAFDPNSYGPNSMYEASAGELTPTGLNPSFNKKPLEEWYKEWEGVGVKLRDKKPADQQGEIYDWALKNNPDILRDMWTQYGINNKGKAAGVDTSDLSDEGLKKLKKQYQDNLLGARTFNPAVDPKGRTPNIVTDDMTPQTNVQAPQAARQRPAGTTSVANPQFAANTTLPYNPNIPLSPLQSLNVLYSGLQALTVPKHYPMRPQVQSPLVELEKLDPRAQINQANQAAYQAYQAASTLNPVIAAANNSSVYGRNLEAVNQIQSQYDNRNVEIGNQQNLLNNQIQRQDQQANIGFNQQYYDRVQATNQNYADETRMAANQTFGLFNQYRSQNDALGAALQSQRMYTRPVVDRRGRPVLDQNGQPVMQQSPLFDVNNTGWSPQVYYTGAGGLENVPQQPNTGDVFNATMQGLLNQGVKPDVAAVVAGRLAGRKEALQYSVPQYKKWGGTIKQMRKKK